MNQNETGQSEEGKTQSKELTKRSVSREVIRALEKKINYWKKKLLDLSRRNRLISFKDYKTSTLLIQSTKPFANFTSLLNKQKIYIYKFPEEDEEKDEEGQSLPLLAPLETAKPPKDKKRKTQSEKTKIDLKSLGDDIWIPDYEQREPAGAGNKHTFRSFWLLALLRR